MNAVVTEPGVADRELREQGSQIVDVEVVITLAERAPRLRSLYDECLAAFEGGPYRVRVVVAAEPWARHLLEPLRREREGGAPVRLLMAGQSVGEAALLRSALATTEADVVLAMPAYHRVVASALPRLVDRVRDGADMAVARRWPRKDTALKRVQSRVFHRLLRATTGAELADVACGVRAMRPSLLDDLPLYGDFARFLPVLAMRRGYRVEEISAEQHALDRSPRVYSPGIYLRRVLDVLGLFFLTRFTEKPLRFFGLLGAMLSGVGGLLLAILTFQWFGGHSLADRPLLVLAVLLAVLGTQSIALGLIGEIIVHLHSAKRKPYRLLEVAEPVFVESADP